MSRLPDSDDLTSPVLLIDVAPLDPDILHNRRLDNRLHDRLHNRLLHDYGLLHNHRGRRHIRSGMRRIVDCGRDEARAKNARANGKTSSTVLTLFYINRE